MGVSHGLHMPSIFLQEWLEFHMPSILPFWGLETFLLGSFSFLIWNLWDTIGSGWFPVKMVVPELPFLGDIRLTF